MSKISLPDDLYIEIFKWLPHELGKLYRVSKQFRAIIENDGDYICCKMLRMFAYKPPTNGAFALYKEMTYFPEMFSAVVNVHRCLYDIMYNKSVPIIKLLLNDPRLNIPQNIYILSYRSILINGSNSINEVGSVRHFTCNKIFNYTSVEIVKLLLSNVNFTDINDILLVSFIYNDVELLKLVIDNVNINLEWLNNIVLVNTLHHSTRDIKKFVLLHPRIQTNSQQYLNLWDNVFPPIIVMKKKIDAIQLLMEMTKFQDL